VGEKRVPIESCDSWPDQDYPRICQSEDTRERRSRAMKKSIPVQTLHPSGSLLIPWIWGPAPSVPAGSPGLSGVPSGLWPGPLAVPRGAPPIPGPSHPAARQACGTWVIAHCRPAFSRSLSPESGYAGKRMVLVSMPAENGRCYDSHRRL